MSAIPLQRIEGKYEILEKIREGGMGAIYKVRHRLLDEIRVIKLMRPQLIENEELRARFLREARFAIKLRHPNVARLDDFMVDDDGTAYIVMEYIRGKTLEELLKTGGPPPLGLALEIAQQSLRAMGYLHAKGFVHRDISPDNLMVTEDADGNPQTKLIDLGIAKILGAGDAGLTQTGLFLGKLRYASPEQFGSEGAAAADAKGDIYSFGIVLYELLTGVYPIKGRDPSSLIASHLINPPLAFDETDPDGRLPAGLRAVVLRALAKRPADRFDSAQDFARALVPFRAADDVPADLWKKLLEATFDGDATMALPGSTQARFDETFRAVATPLPTAAADRLPRAGVPAAGRAADGVPAPAADPEERRSRVSALLEDARRHAADHDLAAALAAARQAEALDPSRIDARALASQLASDLARRDLAGDLEAHQADDLPHGSAGTATARRNLPSGPPPEAGATKEAGAAAASARGAAGAPASNHGTGPLLRAGTPAGPSAQPPHDPSDPTLHPGGPASRAGVLSPRSGAAASQPDAPWPRSGEPAPRAAGPMLDLPFRSGAAAPAARETASTAAGTATRPAASPGAAAAKPVPRPRRLPVWTAALAAGAVLAILAGLWLASRHGAAQAAGGDGAPAAGSSASVASSGDSTAAAAAVVGGLIVDALPWGEVIEVRDARGQAVAVPSPSPAYTPLLLPLAAGRYRVRLRNPGFHRDIEVAADVPAAPGAPPARVVAEFRAGDPDDLLQGLGW